MISKLIHYESYTSIPDVDSDLLFETLTEYYRINRNKEVTIEDNGSKGTLGIVFRIKIDNRSYFVKTHKPTPFHRANLEKEYFFLDTIYGAELFLDKNVQTINGFQHCIVIMDELKIENPDVSFENSVSFIHGLREKINTISDRLLPYRDSMIHSGFHFSFLYHKAIKGLDFLHGQDLITKALKRKIKMTLDSCPDTVFSEHFFCHGDLSDKNIMLKDGHQIVIDWEDAMLGSSKFDLGYWLTFMNQRKYYQTREFKNFLGVEKDIFFFMVLVLLLKSYLSVLDGSISKNKVSVQERIEELYDLT